MRKKSIVLVLLFIVSLSVLMMGDAKRARSADDLESKLNI